MEDRWLLIDVAHKGEVRIASAMPNRPMGRVHSFNTAALPTFTDALMQFERQSGERLFGLHAVIAMAGPAVGDAIPITRTRWNISRSGLASMLGHPVTILNEVAAHAWAMTSTVPATSAIRGLGKPDLRERGRYLFVTLEDGVGTAIIDIDEAGQITVLDAEGGHSDFAPMTPGEEALCRALAPLGGPVSYEQMLIIDSAGPASRILSAMPERERDTMRARILGRLTVNQIISTGAWSGAMLCGRSLPAFTAANRDAFDESFSSRKALRRLVTGVRCWRVEEREAVLTGAAAMMAQRHRMLHRSLAA